MLTFCCGYRNLSLQHVRDDSRRLVAVWYMRAATSAAATAADSATGSCSLRAHHLWRGRILSLAASRHSMSFIHNEVWRTTALIFIYMNYVVLWPLSTMSCDSLKPRYLYIWTMSCCGLYPRRTVPVYGLEYPLCATSNDACHLVDASIALVCVPNNSVYDSSQLHISACPNSRGNAVIEI